jgi:hypothetical protein
VIALHAWPGGLAVVVEGATHRAVAVFGPDGWRRGEPRVVFPDGPPPGTQSFTLAGPDWFMDQIAPLELSLGGVHTDFIRLDRLLSRLQAQAANGAVLVLGPRPAVVVLSGGRLHVIEPSVPAGAPALPILAGSDGWVLVFTGQVATPVVPKEAPEATAAPVAAAVVEPTPFGRADTTAVEQIPAASVDVSGVEPEPVALVDAEPAVSEPAVAPEPAPSNAPGYAVESVTQAVQVPAPAAHVDERFVASSDIVRSMPDDVAAEITAAVSEDGLAVVALLDGSHTVADVAASLGLSVDQVSGVVRLLVVRKLAFRYVSRVRPATGAKASG